MKKVTMPAILLSSLFLAGCTHTTVPGAPITGTEEQKAEKLAAILASGGSATCKITNLKDNTEITYVVSGKKMKISGNEFGEGKKGTIINDSIYTYSWQEGQTTGMKIKNLSDEEVKDVAETQKEDTGTDAESKAAMYEDETTYRTECSKAIVSDSEFVPPTTVKFVDPTETTKMTPEQLMKLYPSDQ